ncbi:hypothetical protein KJ632_03635, partial [Patescibacteria group bacterium]|nr:hypothetical protein [Patescibacteria group bacterium]
YREYFELSGDLDLLPKIKELVQIYFEYIQFNVHFTAYTDNVEACSSLVNLLIPYLNEEEKAWYLSERERMWEKALMLRAEKTF